MTIRKTAYEATACLGFLINKTKEALEEAMINGWLGWLEDNHSVRTVEQSTGGTNTIPSFSHPMIFKKEPIDPSDDAAKFISIIDIRPFGRYENGNYNVKNSTEYNLMVLRGQLNSIWVNRNTSLLRDVSSMPIGIYASWVSESVARRFALDPREQMNLAILAAIFYNSCFTDEEKELEEREKQRLAVLISKAIRVKSEDVFAIMDQVSVIKDITEFCKIAPDVVESIRLKELNTGLLFSILGGTWFGANAKEMIAVAIEHPPTWIAILFAAFSERTYKNSGITRIAERSSFREAGKDFTKAVSRLVEIS